MRGGQADMCGIRSGALGNQSGLQNPLRQLPRSVRHGQDFALSQGLEPAAGCRFADRCPLVTARCRAEQPPFVEVAGDHFAACWEVAA